MILTADWFWRSREPAKCKPNESYPYGQAADISYGASRTCTKELPYPAPGVGTWIVHCATCDLTVGITAAGRADDPTKIKVACKHPANDGIPRPAIILGESNPDA